MPIKPAVSLPEAKDRHSQLLVLGVGFFALKYAATAAMHLVSEDVSAVLDYAELVLALLGVAAIVPVIVWKARTLPRLPAHERTGYFATDSFTMSAMARARTVSWSAGFLLLVALEVVSDRLTNLPSEFFLQTAIAAVLGVFAATFFWIVRPGGAADA